MKEFTHQAFAPQFPRKVSAARVRRSVALARYMNEPAPLSNFSTGQLLAVFSAVLSDRILLFFLKEDSDLTIRTIAAIVQDHERESARVPKDLQLNLVSNLIVRLTKARSMPLPKQFEYAETLIRRCEFDDEFKLALKKALFDRKALQCEYLMIHPFQA